MTLPNAPTGRVAETRFRDFVRAMVRNAQPQPARPTKTIIAPAAPDPGARAGADSPPPETMPLIGGWSLVSDPADASGALVLVHEDGSRQVLANRTLFDAVPAPTITTEPTEGDDQHG